MDKRLVLAVRYLEAGLDGEAWALVQEMAAGPDALDVLRLAATLRLKAAAPDEALAFADRAVGLAPLDGAAWHLKGRAHHLLADLAAAEAALGLAVRIEGGSAHAWSDFGNVLADLGRPEEAAGAFREAIAADPSFDTAYNNLGAVLASQGAFAAAAACYGEALRLSPGNHAARLNLGVAQLEQGEVATGIDTLDAVLREAPQRGDAQDNRLYARLYIEENPAVIAAEHRAWGAAVSAVSPLPVTDPNPDRRLRIGYVSPDFRRHAVATFLAPFIGAHDAAAVEVFCYADVVRPDTVTERLRAAADHWRQVHGWSDETLAAQIEADRIDILVDLAGHTQGNRLGLFARRAAPLQVTALGYAATTGLAAMDARFCDAVTDPSGAEPYASETLLRLIPSLHCYEPLPAPLPGPLPAAATGVVTFGSFNKLAKISDPTVHLWARVLRDLPTSRLMVKSKPLTEESTRAALAARFAAHGIDPARLTLRGWRPDDGEHMGLYGLIDIALDTFPYNGTTTTCEALWMGVPVLTLMGAGHAARVSASVLTAAGLPDWIAETPAAFAALAGTKAADLPALAGVRAGLRDKMRASHLCDAPAHARGVEAAYRALWREKLRGNSAG